MLEDLLGVWLSVSGKLMENVAPLSGLLKQWGPSDMKAVAILLSLHAVCYTKLNREIVLTSTNNWNLRKENLSKWKILGRGLQIEIEVSNNASACTSYSWRTSVFKSTIVDRRLSTEIKISEERLLILGMHLAKWTTSHVTLGNLIFVLENPNIFRLRKSQVVNII